MELLNLQYGESFEITLKGEKVKVTLLKNKESPHDFRLGIEAPQSISVNREEVYNSQ